MKINQANECHYELLINYELTYVLTNQDQFGAIPGAARPGARHTDVHKQREIKQLVTIQSHSLRRQITCEWNYLKAFNVTELQH